MDRKREEEKERVPSRAKTKQMNILFALAVWWMRWTSQLWSWMKHSGNFKLISVSKEKLRK